MKAREQCRKCRGSGRRGRETCVACAGSGEVIIEREGEKIVRITPAKENR